MKQQRSQIGRTSMVAVALGLSLFAVGCKKKVPAPAAPPTPVTEPPKMTPRAPQIGSFTVEPSRVDRGQSATLRWSTSDATDVNISGIGAVNAQGNRSVSPNQTTTYTLTAKGPGGETSRAVTLTVGEPVVPRPAEPPKAPSMTWGQLWQTENAGDAYFDYDKSDIRPDARETLTKNADVIKRVFGLDAGASFTVEGHCDERGSAEYNLGLGDRRATAAKELLTQLGVAADKLRTISYGKERPTCTEANESCWQKNRRAHIEPVR
ncbi:MAG: OmpA family protein [Bryobacteraceae bacterium]|nr:OmpA family protein [Bryobacteraceae bacterium]